MTEHDDTAAGGGAAAGAGAAAAGPAPAPRRRRITFGLVGQAGAVVGLVSAAAGLFFLFRPDAKPHAAPTQIAAQVSELEVEPGATFRDYLVQKNVPLGRIAPALLRQTGAILTVQWTAKGLAGRPLPLRWELIDETRGEHVGDEQARTLRPDRDDDSAGLLLWTPVARDGHRYRVVVTIYRPGQRTAITFLDRRSSAPFTLAVATR